MKAVEWNESEKSRRMLAAKRNAIPTELCLMSFPSSFYYYYTLDKKDLSAPSLSLQSNMYHYPNRRILNDLYIQVECDCVVAFGQSPKR